MMTEGIGIDTATGIGMKIGTRIGIGLIGIGIEIGRNLARDRKIGMGAVTGKRRKTKRIGR